MRSVTLFRRSHYRSSSDNLGGTVDAFNVSLLLDFELATLQATPSLSLTTLSFEALKIGPASLDLLFTLVSDDIGVEIGTQGVPSEVSVVPLPGGSMVDADRPAQYRGHGATPQIGMFA